MKSKFWLGASIPVLAASALFLGSAVQGSSEPATADAFSSFQSQLQILTEPQNKQDILPVPLLEKEHFIPESSRYLGETKEVNFWVAQHTSSTICIVSMYKSTEFFSASSCGDQLALAQTGIGTFSNWVEGEKRGSSEAYLIPDGYLSPGKIAGKDEAISSNLLVRDSSNAESNLLSLKPLEQKAGKQADLSSIDIRDLSFEDSEIPDSSGTAS